MAWSVFSSQSVPETETLADLRRRIKATQWPEKGPGVGAGSAPGGGLSDGVDLRSGPAIDRRWIVGVDGDGVRAAAEPTWRPGLVRGGLLGFCDERTSRYCWPISSP